MPTRKTSKRRPRRAGATAARKPARRAARRPARRTRPRAEQPLGAGMADSFAVHRLKVPAPVRGRTRSGVREIGWAEFGRLSTELAARIAAAWQPDVVLGIANAGVFVGGALAPALGAELVHLHLPGRGAETERLPSLAARRVLVVDDTAESGRTLARATAMARKARAAEVRTAVVVLKPGAARPDWHALESDDVIVFGWDYQFHGGEPGSGDPGETGV
jgi:hypoxanthine phosphoribosyltransferase